MAQPSFTADVPVADWVSKNAEIFRTPPQATEKSKRTRSLEGTVDQQQHAVRAGGSLAARMRADLSEDDGQGTIDPPAFQPPASYYQDVRNHSSIATTMLVTARRQVGFQPSLAGQALSAQQMDEFVTRFYRWLMELDNYWPYIDIKSSQVRALGFHSGDENRIDEDVSNFLRSFWGLSDEVEQAWRRSLNGVVKGASAYVNQHGANVSQVSFQTDIIDTAGKADPMQALSFGRTVQSEPPNGKYDSVLTTGATYLVNSRAIIASAEDFAQNGLSIFGVKEYYAYVNTGNN